MLPLNQIAYEHLKELIIENKLSYDEVYSETRLARELGVSRTPLRDAVHRLTQEGYLDIIPNKGFMLHQITEQDINETFEVRSALELYCAIQICKEYKTAKAQNLFKKLHTYMDQMEKIMKSSHSIEEFSEYDFLFHISMIEYLGNEQFTSIFYSLLYRMKTLATFSLSHEGRMEDTYREHLDILDSLENGKTDTIYQITMVHMEKPKGINLNDL